MATMDMFVQLSYLKGIWKKSLVSLRSKKERGKQEKKAKHNEKNRKQVNRERKGKEYERVLKANIRLKMGR